MRNYPIRKRGDEEIKELAYATLERRIELAELEVVQLCMKSVLK